MKTRAVGMLLTATAFLTLAAFSFSGKALAQDGPYKLGTAIKLGGDGGWDYLNVDSDARRLYIARGTKYMVVDLDAGKLVGEVGDINAEFQAFFASLGSSLAGGGTQLGTLGGATIGEKSGELVIMRNTPDGPTLFPVHLIRDVDGIWRIESM